MPALTRADLSRFVAALARRLPCPAKLVLTGGVEAFLLGGTRPTGDLDFELMVPKRYERLWGDVEAAVAAASAATRAVVQYSTDIDRWSAVSIPERRRKTRPLRRVGRLSVHLLDPTCWAVYKLARYLDADVDDLRAVLARQRVSGDGLARLCGICLRTSSRSTQLFLFRRQVAHFFRAHGRAVWGRGFDAERAIALFRRAAKISAA
jgi:hypothetical protein